MRRTPLLLSGCILLLQAFPFPGAVRDAATLAWTPSFHLQYPLWHVIFTPFCSVADFLTILSLKQMILAVAILTGVPFLVAGWRRGLISFAFLLGFVAWGALVPRPMAHLVAQDPDVLLIDLHSHSQYSHDGRHSFTPDANRRWHWLQGYGAGFITDHNRVEASQQAKGNSRKDWKTTGYRSLEGEEISLWKTHLVVLGAHERIDNQPYDSDPAKVGPFIKEMKRRKLPVIASLPEYWFYHWGGGVQDLVRWGIDGFEIINCAPKALDFPISKRLEIVDLCRRQNLLLTGISDNHGYGYATAAWNAMRIPGWRTMDPDALEKAVLETLRKDRFQAVQVLERVNHFPLISLQPFQAISWVAWIWAFSFLYPRKIRLRSHA